MKQNTRVDGRENTLTDKTLEFELITVVYRISYGETIQFLDNKTLEAAGCKTQSG